MTEAQALRAYDAVHLAAALQVVEADLVLVAGDQALLTAAESVGLMVTAVG
ncbi:MAG: twitching motility protein PilT [Actinobacteria bacterium]|nr:twitching motility protein PilT [Actinomycetota bacterium]